MPAEKMCMRFFRSPLVLLANCFVTTLMAQPKPDVEWRSYANDAGGSHYSAVADIDRQNVSKLQVAWTYHTHALEPVTDLNHKAAFEATAVMVEGTLVTVTPFNKVIALDPATGTERWSYDPKIDRDPEYSEVTSRGVAVWRGGKGRTKCGTRVFIGTIDARLIALVGRTGQLCPDFGDGGQVALAPDAKPAWPNDYEVTSPPAIVGDVVVVGSSIGDNSNVDTGRGVVRSFDVRSGKLRWSFDPLLPKGEGWRAGAANAWAVIAADPARGLVFVPTSSPSPDYFGGFRPGDDRYANSVVAIEAATGKVRWHFQVVHHDLWDYDIASQPVLVDVPRAGGNIAAVVVTTKMGHLFVLDRMTGKPIFPVEERPVPKSDIPGDEAWPTQPFPTNPPLVPTRITPDDAWGATAEDRDWCRQRIASLRYEGIFTPPTVGGTLVYPGNIGGVAWGGASYDPKRGLLMVGTNRFPFLVRLIPRAAYDEERTKGRDNRLSGEFSAQRGTPFGMYREPLASPHHLPCIAPPFGMLVAVDLRDGSHRWEIPVGEVTLPSGAMGNPEPLKITGLPMLGGSLTTAGGLVFIAGTMKDDTLRAFDVESGKLVWSSHLPAGAQSTPMTYRYHGKQYIVISAGGHGKADTTMGDSVVAYALP